MQAAAPRRSGPPPDGGRPGGRARRPVRVGSRWARRYLQPSLPDPDGRLISLDDFRGKRVLLVHWNPDCAFCELLAPDLAQFQADLRTSKVQLVLASSEDAESNRELALEHGLTCPILLMPDDGSLARETFKDQGTPVAYLLDEQGKVAQPVAVGGDEIRALARGSSANEPRGSGSPASALCPKAASSGTASRRVPSPWSVEKSSFSAVIGRLLAELHHCRAARIRVVGGGAGAGEPHLWGRPQTHRLRPWGFPTVSPSHPSVFFPGSYCVSGGQLASITLNSCVTDTCGGTFSAPATTYKCLL